jgi:hypothetical protein
MNAVCLAPGVLGGRSSTTAYDESGRNGRSGNHGRRAGVLNSAAGSTPKIGGSVRTYRAVEEKNGGAQHARDGTMVARRLSTSAGTTLGNLNLQCDGGVLPRNIQFPFFRIPEDKPAKLPEAWMFLTGVNEFRRLDVWPPKGLQPETLYFDGSGTLSRTRPEGDHQFDEYVSDPNRPVPYVGYVAPGMTGDYMTEDQRFASRRTDVLVYQTAPLDKDMIIAGPVQVSLHVSTTGTDSDFVVKLVDVYPNDYPTPAAPAGQPVRADAVKMGGYQQMVTGEPFREVPQRLRETGAIRPRRAGGHHLRIARRLSRVSQGASGDGPGAELVVPADRSQSPGLHGNPDCQPIGFQESYREGVRSGALASSITLMVEGR